jgi:hypothetical protein
MATDYILDVFAVGSFRCEPVDIDAQVSRSRSLDIEIKMEEDE